MAPDEIGTKTLLTLNLFNLNESEAVEVAVKNPLVLEKLRIAREVYEADRIINLPNLYDWPS